MDISMLAMHCRQVAVSAAANSSQVEQARRLKTDWALFIGHTHPPQPRLDGYEDIEAYGKELKQRMVNFLARCSVSPFLAKEPAKASNFNADRATVGRGE